jgi:hypothetical protein
MADNTILNTGTGGDTIASDDISSVKYQRVKLIHGADGVNDGDVSTTNPFPVRVYPGAPQAYSLHIPASAAGSNQVHFDLFNATGSGKVMRIWSVRAIKDGSVGVTGTVGIKLFLTRTTAVGTGGTAATENGTTITSPAISEMDGNNDVLPAGVTARLRPTGGATGGAVISTRNIFGEETNAATYDTVEFIPTGVNSSIQPLVVRENSGIRVVQGSVASAGNTDFQVLFTLE